MTQLAAHLRAALAVSLCLTLASCVLTPKGADREQSRLRSAGQPYETPVDQRQLPDLPPNPTWHDILHRAFLANGDLESKYFEWKAAMARIPQVAGYPDTNLAPSFSYMFNSARMTSFNRTTVSLGFDPMKNLSFPTKVAKAGQIALEEGRAAGNRFLAAKFELQRKILSNYFDYELAGEKIRIARDNVALLKLISDTASSRVGAGGPQQDLLKAQIQYRLAENDLANMQSDEHIMRAMLNGMLARPMDAPLPHGDTLPAARPVPADDALLIALAVDQNPEIAGLARDVQGRQDALDLARMAYIPDINPSVAFTGSIAQMVGAMLIIPTTIPQIQGAIEESKAMLRSTQAMARQTRSDRAASFIANLYAMRNAQRQVALLSDVILPSAQRTLADSRQAYAAGSIGFIELIDSQRTLLEVRQMIAEARTAREKSLTELEALAGVDFETLNVSRDTGFQSVPATQKSSGSLLSQQSAFPPPPLR